MPTQLGKGHTFVDGDTGISAATLNSIVDSGRILPGAISEQPSAVPAVEDSFLFNKSTGGLKRCTLAQIIAKIPANGPHATAALRKLGIGSTMAAPGDDNRFPQFQHGVRMGNGAGGADTIATPVNLSFTPTVLTGPTHTEIDWSVNNIFYDSLTQNKTYTFAHAAEGRSIQLIIKRNTHTPTLPTAIGTVVVGTGTTFLHVYLTKTAGGITGLQIAI